MLRQGMCVCNVRKIVVHSHLGRHCRRAFDGAPSPMPHTGICRTLGTLCDIVQHIAG